MAKNSRLLQDRETYAALKAAGLCTRCRKPVKGEFTRCKRCTKSVGSRISKMRQQRVASGCCAKCGKPTDGASLCKEHLEKNLKARKRYYVAIKHAAIMAYGGYRCACPGCDVTAPEFLQIDHVDNDGATHRKELRQGGDALYAWLKRHNYPPGFQILCANCNFAKRITGTCPVHNK